ncbi:MAG: SAM-dependent chlorinase/fluorinase [Flavobacteriaceae bacterium]|jgi:S-adenosyl-L-methionine hydrolase (adenosine-forming)|nr:SAM-dependent chlorinase/fluorinase [Flavobacteriaceae bacterium]
MTLVTLTTDFGLKDYSVAVIKAALYQSFPTAIVVDISHQISPYDPSQAAYILKNAYPSFPQGSVHIIGVESELTPENKHLAMRLNGHYFIGADNGIFSMIADGIQPEAIVEINIHEAVVTAFPVLDIFVNVAAHLMRKGTLDVIGRPITNFKELTDIKPVINKNQILGSVIYIDNYGNVITNITRKIFEEVGKQSPFTIRARTVRFHAIYETYSQAIEFNLPKEKREEDGKKLALFNTAGHLELAIYKSNPATVGSAASLYGLDYRDPITIEFER